MDGTIALPTENEVVFSFNDNPLLQGIPKIGGDPYTIRDSYKGTSQITNILDFVSHAVSLHNHRQYINEWVWPHSNKTLDFQEKVVDWIWPMVCSLLTLS